LQKRLRIVLCAVYLEKYLVTLTGYAAFKLFIPAACVLFAGNLILKNRSIGRLARRLLAFGICIFLVVPASVKLSDLIDNTYHAQIEMTLEEAKEDSGERIGRRSRGAAEKQWSTDWPVF
jgi:hypothetical protein